MKKVLMFQDYFYQGGIEKVILDIKKNIGRDYNINILSMVNKSNENIISLLNKDYPSFFKRIVFGIKKYKKHLKNNKYDIIHIHCYNSFGLIYAKIAKKYCNKIIVHAHNSNIDNDFLYIKHIINYIIRLLFKNNSYLYIAVSDECNKLCFNNKKTIILPNSIDYDIYSFNMVERKKYREEFNIKNSDIVIGHIGRFNKQKNHKFIIKIFNEIIKKNKNYKLILIGTGKLENKIREMIDNYSLSSNVIIMNNREDIPKLINMFDIYLFPSLYEGFPISLIENEVNGKYIFMSDNITKDAIISNRVETISLNNDEYYWAKEIMNLKDKKLILNSQLNIKKYCEKLDNIYKNL